MVACNLCRSFTNFEESLALAVEQLLGYNVDVNVTENHIEFGYTEPVTYCHSSTSSVFLRCYVICVLVH